MRQTSLLLSVAVLSIACAGRGDRVEAAHPPLGAGVHVLTPDDMHSWCNMVYPDGEPVDPEGMCEDFRPAPLHLIATFEARLPSLLVDRGYRDIAHAVDRYVRQYWAVFRDGRLYVVGNFVCHSLAQALGGHAGDDVEPVPEDHLAHAPFVVDDAGACNVTASFPADQPDAVQFLI